MKKLFYIFTLAVIASTVFSGCNNKPPFVRLAEAIDSCNVQYNREYNLPENLISYNEWENEVVFTNHIPEVINRENFEAQAADIKRFFLESFVRENEFNIATETIDAKANIILRIYGMEDTKYEILIEANEILEAYNAVHSTPMSDPNEEVDVENLNPGEVQHELEEGNVTTIENAL